MIELFIALGITTPVAIGVSYAIGRHHGWMSAQQAYREQRAPLRKQEPSNDG